MALAYMLLYAGLYCAELTIMNYFLFGNVWFGMLSEASITEKGMGGFHVLSILISLRWWSIIGQHGGQSYKIL
jgi:hypothetical protein